MEDKEEITTNQKNKKKKSIQKNESSVSSLWDNFKRSNICIIGETEEEDKNQEIGNLFEKIMKESVYNLAREISLQEAQRVPKKLDPRKHTPRHLIIKLTKIKDERILKASRERERVTYKGVPSSRKSIS